jgi:protein-S-isoprenylcysteine O-methyltransferase Ste14
MNVALFGSGIAAGVLLIVWGRQVLHNHLALGRTDDRALVSTSDFFGIAAMAIRGIDGKVADPKLPRRARRESGGRIATLWSRLFVSSFALVWILNLFFVTRRQDESLNQMISRLGRSGAINLTEALLLVVTAVVGVLAMVEIGEGQSVRADPSAVTTS